MLCELCCLNSYYIIPKGVNHILNEGVSKMSIPHGDILDTPSLIYLSLLQNKDIAFVFRYFDFIFG